jgi:MoxR-like ATPase
MKAFADYAGTIEQIKAEISKAVIGQETMIELMIITLLSKGHILLEGVPGLAKSLAVETFAKVIGGDFRRFQFTPDKMPSDITGAMVYNEKEKKFDFFFGPIFCNIFLADEINRASPKVQSALLQAMQEKKIDIERMRYDIPNPFTVLATEAQVDRFMVKYDVAYPAREEEADLIARKHTNFEELKADIQRVITPEQVIAMQELIHKNVRVSQKVINYILNICIATRPPSTYNSGQPDAAIYEYIRLGASPRATEFLLSLSKSYAFCHGRDYVDFDDVNQCAVHVLRHRILLNSQAVSQQINADMIVNEIFKMVKPY